MQRKIALITGASSGLGKEFAEIFAENGYGVFLVARSEADLRKLADSIHRTHPGCARIHPCDLTNPEQLNLLLKEIEGISIDVLVNNAGYGLYGNFDSTDLGLETGMLKLNAEVPLILTKEVGREMLKRGEGRILQVASAAAFQPGPFMSVYFATKSFLLSFSEAVDAEWRSRGVTVTTLCPGPTRTNFENVAGLPNRGMFKAKRLPSARSVAEFGFRALEKRKRVAVHGGLNRFLILGVRLLPRSWVLRIAKFIIRA